MLNIKMFSTNGAGIVEGKIDSLNAQIRMTDANIVTLQETHSKRKGQIHMNKTFVIFEAIRKAKNGGTMCAIHEDLKPKLIEEYDDPFELLVVEIISNKKEIRVITGHGPQENWDEVDRRPFFVALESEIVKAKMLGKSFVIEIDANSKLGKQYIPNDPKPISGNGHMLADIIERHALVVANGSSKCTGTITRKRITKKSTELSAIDIVLLSSDMEEHLVSLQIDEERKYVLTRITDH